MKVSLINLSNRNTRYTDNLCIGSIAAFLRQKAVHTDLIYMEDTPTLEKEVEKVAFSYNIFGFPLFTINALLVYKVAQLLKKKNPNAIIFVGGRLATKAANFILEDCPEIDLVVLGDGEYPVLELVTTIESKKDISNIASIKCRGDIVPKKEAIIDIKSIPFPARDNLTDSLKRGNFSIRISTSRSCCGSCSFCSVNNYTNKWQGRDSKEMFEEVKLLYNEFGVRSFIFNDGSFEDPGRLGKERIKEFCNMLIDFPIKFSFRCFLRAETFSENDLELILLMRKGGFSQVFVGIEAANNSDLELYKKRASVRDNHRVMKIFKQNDINVVIGFIMLNPLSTVETLRDNYLFLRQHRSYFLLNYISKAQVYFGTELHKHLGKLGLLKPEFSYLSPLSYLFENEWAYQVSTFIDEFLGSSDILNLDFNFMELAHIVNDLKVLYPEEISDYKDEFYLIQDEIAINLSEFFEIIYIDRDLNIAKIMIESFIKDLQVCYQKAKAFGLRLMKVKHFRDYFFRN